LKQCLACWKDQVKRIETAAEMSVEPDLMLAQEKLT